MITNLAADIHAFTSNVFLVNGDRQVLVDAGANFDVVTAVREHVDHLDAVVITHTHPDHIGNVDTLRDAFDIETWGFDGSTPAVDHALEDGAMIQLGDHEYEALYTPGHAPDHLCLYAEDPGILFAGDLIFANGGIGRTDFPGCDHDALIESIDRIAERVDSSLRELHAGHGPSVTTNPEQHVAMASQVARSG